MPFSIDTLIRDLQAETSDPRTKEILAAVTRDAVMLSTQALSGIDVERELQVLKATMASLGAQKAAAVSNRIQRTMIEVIGGVLNKALA